MHGRPRSLAFGLLFVSTGLLTACPSEEGDGGSGADDVAPETDGATEGEPETGTDGDPSTSDTGETTDPTTDPTEDPTTDPTEDPTTETTGGAACGNDPGWGPLQEGELAKHIQGFDQHGEAFDMCEFAGTPIIIDVAAVWCGPCNQVSQYFSQGGADPFGGGLGDQLTTMINNDTVIWLTTLVEDANSAPATVEVAAMWDQQYPHPKIPVVVEGDISMLPSYFQLGCWPSAFIVDHEMKWMGFDDCQTWNQLVEVVQTYGG
jgi:hypothetical protein